MRIELKNQFTEKDKIPSDFLKKHGFVLKHGENIAANDIDLQNKIGYRWWLYHSTISDNLVVALWDVVSGVWGNIFYVGDEGVEALIDEMVRCETALSSQEAVVTAKIPGTRKCIAVIDDACIRDAQLFCDPEDEFADPHIDIDENYQSYDDKWRDFHPSAFLGVFEINENEVEALKNRLSKEYDVSTRSIDVTFV